MRRLLKHFVLSSVRTTCGARAHGELARAMAGIGCIFVMHRVVAQKSDSPAQKLTITTDYLDQALGFLRESGAEFIALSTLGQRLASGAPFARPFVCLTFDDGFRDNLTLALPILRKHQAPATIFTPSGAPDRTVDVWFLRLEKAVMSNDELKVDLPGFPSVLATGTLAQKCDAYRQLSLFVHQNLGKNKAYMQNLLPSERVSDEALAAERFVTWDELRELADDPLVTIGGHTVNHPVLRDLEEEEAWREIIDGRDRLSAELERPIELFSYPYGGREEVGRREVRLAQRAGFRLAVTTYYGQVQPSQRSRPFQFPRMTLGGLREDIGALAFDVLGCMGPGMRSDPRLHPAPDPLSRETSETIVNRTISG